jgi:hypothetical protein
VTASSSPSDNLLTTSKIFFLWTSLRLFEETLLGVLGTAENYDLEEITSVFRLFLNRLLIVTLDDDKAEAPVIGL